MRVTAMISFLIFFIISETAAIDFTSCYEKMQMTVPKSDPKQFYGSLNPFYSINKGIADGLQKQMDDSTLQDVYNLIAGTKGDKPSVGKVVNDVMKQQAGAIAFFCGGLLFILVAVVLGITICSCRCCCNSCGADKTKSHPSSSITAFFMVSGLVAVFAFVLTGVVIFNLSATNLYKAIDKSPGWINDTVNSINTNVFDGTSEMNCVVENGVNETLNVLTVQMLAFPQNLSTTLMNATGLTNLHNFDYTKLENDAITAADLSDKLDTELNNTCKDLKTLLNVTNGLGPQLRNLSQIVVLVDKIQGAAISNISSATNNTQITGYLTDSIALIRRLEDQLTVQLNSLTSQVNISMQTVRNIQNAINTAQNDTVNWSGYSAVKGGWQALMTVPNCICLLFCLLTIFALLHWLYAEEGGHAAGYVAIFGFYFTIFLTVIAMGVTSAAFVGGWAISGACKPMFEDSTFKILGLASNIGNINITGLNNTSTSTSVQQLMQRCEGSATVFSAVNGSQLINPSMVLNMLQLDTLENQIDNILQQNPINYNIDPTYLFQLQNLSTFLNVSITTLSAADNGCFLNDAGVEDKSNLTTELMGINNELATLIELFSVAVAHSADNTTTNVSVQFTNSQILIATNLVNSSTTDMINNLNSQAFPCHGLYQNYENAGVILCDWFGRPVHGMWGAAGLAAIFFIPAALIMLCAANKIFSGYCSRTNKIGDETGAPAGLHRTKTTENPWEDSDPFPRPAVYNTQPQQYSYVPPPVQEADYGTGLRRQNEAGLRRQDDGLQRTDPDSYGLRKTAERPAWEDSDDEQPAPYDIYNLDKDRTGKGLTRM